MPHLRVIKDEIREEDQVEECMRGVWVCGVREQRANEWVDGLSPDVSHRTYCATSRELDVLLDVEDQIVDERLFWIICEDDLHNPERDWCLENATFRLRD